MRLPEANFSAMATPMGPPVLPGYSLRVQLFSPNAHGLGDKPIRCFRVVTSPDATIQEFCQEASRIHEINYGEWVLPLRTLFQASLVPRLTLSQVTCDQESAR